jgi:hypothetical protein
MIKVLRRAWALADNYALARLTGRPSTAAFWYTPDAPAIRDAADLDSYLAAREPVYPIDYRPKLRYGLRNASGVVVLPYPDPIGERVNPEATAQFALGAHAAWAIDGDAAARATFLRHANFLRSTMTADGLWIYDFDWFANRAPWASALAQSRGASVMLRAARMTGDTSFGEAARRSLRPLARDIADGGFRAVKSTRWGEAVYFEEYPKHPTAVLNGSIAALFGLFEVAHFLEDEQAADLWIAGTNGLAAMLPLYDAGWWTLYDLDPAYGRRNYDSPHYHDLSTTYVGLLALLDPVHRDVFSSYHRRWVAQASAVNRLRAVVAKTHFKLTVR